MENEKKNIFEEFDRETPPGSALITGASGGIGRAMAARLAGTGFRLYLCGNRHGDELLELAQSLSERYHILCKPLLFDLQDEAATKAALEEIPSLDMVICCAGIAHFALLQETQEEDWARVLQINLTGTWRILRCALPLLFQSNNPRILLLSSVWGSHGAAMESAYSASKGGLDALTKSLAKELAPRGIPVNAIACGVIDTEMNRAHLSPEDLERLKEEIPAGRFGTPVEVASFAWLLLQAPAYLTGQIIGFDGAWQI